PIRSPARALRAALGGRGGAGARRGCKRSSYVYARRSGLPRHSSALPPLRDARREVGYRAGLGAGVLAYPSWMDGRPVAFVSPEERARGGPRPGPAAATAASATQSSARAQSVNSAALLSADSSTLRAARRRRAAGAALTAVTITGAEPSGARQGGETETAGRRAGWAGWAGLHRDTRRSIPCSLTAARGARRDALPRPAPPRPVVVLQLTGRTPTGDGAQAAEGLLLQPVPASLHHHAGVHPPDTVAVERY
ncbi:DNA-directed RNA polymerase I subunit RPA43, partial [Frankliniella fusca]